MAALKRRLALPCFHHTDKTLEMKQLGIQTDYSDWVIETIYMWDTPTISRDLEQPHLSCITINNSDFLCNIPIEELIEIVEDHLRND